MTASSSDVNADQLKTWTCLKCGAPLPEEVGPGESVTCTYCGTPFKLPTATSQSGGVSISTSGAGAIKIGGNVVGGDLVLGADGTPQPSTALGSSAGVTLRSGDVQIGGHTVGGNLYIPAGARLPNAVTQQPITTLSTKAPEQQTSPADGQGSLSKFLNRLRKK